VLSCRQRTEELTRKGVLRKEEKKSCAPDYLSNKEEKTFFSQVLNN